ncbi:MAG: hypothetical protein K2L81_03495, partial [Muribaculaceae bacterium]|nr:hypothetical protein [Muribaculaceae bacterium]
MHKTLLILLFIVPLMWSCGGSSADSSDSDTIAKKTALDSLSYLEGRLSGLETNLSIERALNEVPDSIKSYYDKNQYIIGLRSAMAVDTTSPTSLYVMMQTAQMFLNYSFIPNSNYAPIDYDIFLTQFTDELMSTTVDEGTLIAKSQEMTSLIDRISKSNSAQLQNVGVEISTLMGQVAGLSMAYEINQNNSMPDAPKIDKKDALKGVEQYIALRPRSVGFQMGFIYGLHNLTDIMTYRQHKIYLSINDFADAYIEAFNETGVTNETLDNLRQNLSELLNR